VWERISAELDKHDTSLRSLYGDGWSAPPLKQREFEVLSAVALLEGNGTLAEIYHVAAKVGGMKQFWIMLTLRRLERRELVTVNPSDRFRVTEDGDRALRRAHAEGKVFGTVSRDAYPKGVIR